MSVHRPTLGALVLLSGCSASPPAAEPPAALVTAAPTATVAATAAPAAGVYTVATTTQGAGSKQRAILQVKAPCAQGQCDRPPVDLGPGSATAGLVDLLGPSTRVNHQSWEGMGLPASLPASAGFPAAVVLLHGEPDGQRLVVVSLRDDPPAQILSVALSAHYPDGGGFSTINSIELESTGAGPLEIGFAQTSLPRKTDRNYRPGPPLHRTYRFGGKRYEQSH